MDLTEIKRRMKEAEVDTIRVDYPDLFGICRSKIAPAVYLEELFEDGLNFAKPTFALNLANDVATGTGCGEEVDWEDFNLKLDPTTFVLMPHQPHVGRFIGNGFKKGQPFKVDPRWILRNTLKKFEDKGFRPVAASELEFFVFRKDENGNVTRYCDFPSSVYQVSPRVDELDLLRTLQNTFIKMDFPIIYLNHEFFQSQYEVNWRYDHALKVADQTFTFKAVCKEVAHQHGLLLTFMGRPRNDSGGSGYHLHISLSDPETKRNLFDDPKGQYGLSDLARWFIAGQVAHARGMAAFFAPTINSYKRYRPGSFAPINYAWGLDNRTIYIRVPSERGRPTRLENRAPCASANPYLVFAAAFAAGLDGIENKMDPGDPLLGDSYSAEGLVPVPSTLEEALDEMEKDPVITEAIGPAMIKAFTAVKRQEVERFKAWVTDWEFTEYSHHL
ncbi:MAG: glutamine synthetase family protein [Thermodesulfobacteriota bacterium]